VPERLCRGPLPVEQKFPVPFHARDWRWNRFDHVPAERGNTRADAFNGQRVRLRVADDAPFAYVLPAGLELRFTRITASRSAGAAWNTAPAAKWQR